MTDDQKTVLTALWGAKELLSGVEGMSRNNLEALALEELPKIERAIAFLTSAPSTEAPRCGGRGYCSRMPFCGCGGPDALPERDPSKPAEDQGLFRKFNVTRVDGSDAPGGKHHGCEYFVLDVTHDPHAKAALQAYAAACFETHPELSNDLRQRHGWNDDRWTIKALHVRVEQLKKQLLARERVPQPTVPDNMQDWKGMDGTTAWHLIERHADNWADVGKMMDEWLAANQQAQPAPSTSVELTAERISEIWENHVVPVFGRNGINPIVFARKLLAAAKPPRGEQLERALNPRQWTQEMHDAWNLNIPDLQAAFEALRQAALLQSQPAQGERTEVSQAQIDAAGEAFDNYFDTNAFDELTSGKAVARVMLSAALCQSAPARVVPDGYLCEIEEADFEKNTVTVKMLTSDYEVRAGRYLLAAAPQPQEVGKA